MNKASSLAGSNSSRSSDDNDDEQKERSGTNGDTFTDGPPAPLRIPQTSAETIFAEVSNNNNNNNHDDDQIRHHQTEPSISAVVAVQDDDRGQELSPQLVPTKPSFFSNRAEGQQRDEEKEEVGGGGEDKLSTGSSSSLNSSSNKNAQRLQESTNIGDEEEAKQGEEKTDLDTTQPSNNFQGDNRRLSEDESKEDSSEGEETKKQQQQQQQQPNQSDKGKAKEETPVNKKDLGPAQKNEAEGTRSGGRVASPSPRQQKKKQQQQQAYPVRLQPSAKSLASTEIVQSMFGPTVGQCWGDFSCQYNHVRGRLYASTEAVLFYSNLFGFEKKINLGYDDVLEMSLYRQTSIQVTVQANNSNNDNNNIHNNDVNNNNGSSTMQEAAASVSTQYVFKGFSDRTQTLLLLIELWRQSQGVEGGNHMLQIRSQAPVSIDNNHQLQQQLSPTRSLSPSSGSRMAASATAAATAPSPPIAPGASAARRSSILKPSPQPDKNTEAVERNTTTSGNPPDTSSLRKRSKSVPNLNRRPTDQRRNSETSSTFSTAASTSSSATNAPPYEEDFDWNVTPTKNDQAAWQVAKRSVGAWVKEIGNEPFALPCSLRAFYNLFLANDAKFSVDKYQMGDEVKDLDIKITPWKQDPSDTNALVRTIDFRHPCGSFGVGPSHAPTKRRQRLRRYPGCGISMVSSTTVENLPGSDCFVVEDLWLVEVIPTKTGTSNLKQQQQVKFSTLFGANFTKRTFLRSIIQKNIKSGSKEWYVGYKKMLQSAINENAHLLEEEQQQEQQQKQEEEAPASDDDEYEEDDDENDAPVHHPTAEVKVEAKCFEEKTENSPDLFQRLSLSPMVLVFMMVLQVLLLLVLVIVATELRTSQRTNQGLLEEMKILRLEHGQILGMLLQQQQPPQQGQ